MDDFKLLKLKAAIVKVGLTQRMLCYQLNIDENTFSKIISGFIKPTPLMKTKLSNFLNEPEKYLFNEEE